MAGTGTWWGYTPTLFLLGRKKDALPAVILPLIIPPILWLRLWRTGTHSTQYVPVPTFPALDAREMCILYSPCVHVCPCVCARPCFVQAHPARYIQYGTNVCSLQRVIFFHTIQLGHHRKHQIQCIVVQRIIKTYPFQIVAVKHNSPPYVFYSSWIGNPKPIVLPRVFLPGENFDARFPT
jgi:hypothetical protein